jgi:hypothetical protein
MSEKNQKFILLTVGVLVMSILVGYLVFAWTEPGCNPPNCNVSQPINVGSQEQTKSGTIGAYYFKVLGWDAVYGSLDAGEGVNRPFHLIGTYHGWDPYGVYIAGYNYYNNSSISQAKKVYVGGGGIERLTIDLSTGNVGIGTTAPAYKLDVSGDVRWTGTLQGGSVPWARLTSFPSDCPSGQYVYGVGGTLKCSAPAGGISGSGTTNYVAKFTGSTTIGNSIIYDDGSKVGIGTTSPDPNHKLTVSGSMRSQGAYFEGNVSVGYSGTSYSLTVNGQNVCLANGTNCPAGSGLWAASGSNIYNTNSGNVGIGTTAPSYKLHVQGGDIYSSGYVRGGTGLCIGADCRTSWPGGMGGFGTTNYVAKFTGATTIGNSLIYDDGTNVGIGTNSPAHRLDVQGGKLRVGSGSSAIQLEPQSGFHRFAFEELRFYDWSYGGDMVTFKDGNVGIGTTNPTTGKLVISGGNLDVGNNRIINLATPINSSDAATKGYVDAAVSAAAKAYIVTTRASEAIQLCSGAYPAPWCPSGWTIETSWNFYARVSSDSTLSTCYTQTLCSK